MNIFANVKRVEVGGKIILTCSICEKPVEQKIALEYSTKSCGMDRFKICQSCALELLQSVLTLDVDLVRKAATNMNLAKTGFDV